MEFSEKVKIRCLLWSDRHCCLCNRRQGIDIEVAHIDQDNSNPDDIDNAIPLCYDCHAKIGHYNNEHPRGNQYRIGELKARRDQVYEEHTRQLVPPIFLEVTQNLPGGRTRAFPDVGLSLQHVGESLPVKVLISTEISLGDQCLKKTTDGGGHYGMGHEWNLNPQLGYLGHFQIPEATTSDKRLRVTVRAVIIDKYERHHELLPMSWGYERETNSWFAEP